MTCLARVTGVVRRSFGEFVELFVQLPRLLPTLVRRDVHSSQWPCPQTAGVFGIPIFQISTLKYGWRRIFGRLLQHGPLSAWRISPTTSRWQAEETCSNFVLPFPCLLLSSSRCAKSRYCALLVLHISELVFFGEASDKGAKRRARDKSTIDGCEHHGGPRWDHR